METDNTKQEHTDNTNAPNGNDDFLGEAKHILQEKISECEDLIKCLAHTNLKKDIYLDRYSWGERILFRVGENFDFIRKVSANTNKL